MGPLRLYLGVCACLWVGATPPARGGTDPWEGTPQASFLEGPIVQRYQCVTCHTITDRGGSVGPSLNLVGLRRSEDWIRGWLRDPNKIKSGTKMPVFPFSPEELEAAVRYLSRMKRPLRTSAILAGGAAPVDKGRQLFVDYDCQACHRIGQEGRFVGPDLTWIGVRKSERWERIWLRDPQAFKPGTFMPNFHIPEAAVGHLAAFLHTLQGQQNEDSRESEFIINMMIDNNDVQRGELVWKRLACWSCHGERGQGGVRNPNAVPEHGVIPNLKGVRDGYTLEAFREKVASGSTVPATSPRAVPQPFACPPYGAALDDLEFEDLYAYVSSLAPPKSRWRFKR